MEQSLKSNWRREREESQNLATKWAYIIVILGAVLVFSGLLHYLGLILPVGFIALMSGVWITSLFYIALK